MNPNEYKGSQNVDRMRETIASKKLDLSQEDQPEEDMLEE